MQIARAGIFLKKSLLETHFNEMKGKTFEIVTVTEMFCEVCQKPLGTKEKKGRIIKVENEEDFENLVRRSAAHDRAEVDLQNCKIFFYDHDFPGDIHEKCLETL